MKDKSTDGILSDACVTRGPVDFSSVDLSFLESPNETAQHGKL
jgi:hypothetical protein